MFSMLSVFSEFERAILVERIRAGLARSQKRAGRPPLDPEKDRRARRLLTKGESAAATAKKLRIGLATVYRIRASMAEAA
jgi:DNA invertase Pin-like site-specific DNA recombinase